MIFSVSEANNFIKALLDAVPQLQTVFVRGEISNYKLYPSGHHYFTLKDEGSALKCVMFRGMAGKLRFRPENGMKVIAFGRIGVFPRDGAYQLYCSELSVEGVGDLHVAFEQLKEKLFKEGLFAPEHKKPLPKYPKRIAIITSSAGAAVHDMLRILRKRYPLTKVRLLPVRVQGAEAPGEIAAAIRYANRYKLAALLIVGRGGGSIEELWAFNEEEVARAIFECSVPVISAVGHETDVTIADFVADLRAPTPSAAAELAVYEIRECKKTMSAYEDRIVRAALSQIGLFRTKAERFSMRLKLLHPRHKLYEHRQFTAEMENRIRDIMERRLTQEKHRLALNAERMKRVSPLLKLSSGYSYIRSEEGKNIRSTAQVKRGEKLEIFVSDGKIEAEVHNTETMIHG